MKKIMGKRRPVPIKQNPTERIKNYNEVSKGITKAQAQEEACRCLQCRNPSCIKGCPLLVDIKSFIKYIAEGDFIKAIKKVKEKNNLAAICGRVCPQESQCEASCTLSKKGEPIAIGYLERFVADFEIATEKIPQYIEDKKSIIDKKVAVVGSGPAGLTAAAELAKYGLKTTIFESLHSPGGVLTYGIPEFRLPKAIVYREVEYIKSLGVDIKLNMPIGLCMSIDELIKEGYKAIFIGTGAGLPNFMNIEGENLNGVYSANEFLTRINLMKGYLFPEYSTPVVVGEEVVVVGGGNVAMDAARCAVRLGAKKVRVIYRRSEEELPAREEEYKNAQEEGIEFMFLTLPVRFISNGRFHIKEVECIKMELGEKDTSGRRRSIPIKSSNFTIKADTIIIAIGSSPNPLLLKNIPSLECTNKGTLKVNDKLQTNIEYIFGGGDIITSSATVISAMGQARLAAYHIYEYLSSIH